MKNEHREYSLCNELSSISLSIYFLSQRLRFAAFYKLTNNFSNQSINLCVSLMCQMLRSITYGICEKNPNLSHNIYANFICDSFFQRKEFLINSIFQEKKFCINSMFKCQIICCTKKNKFSLKNNRRIYEKKIRINFDEI